jgi:DNA modification methylase/ParB-like chromosome segregation protein Spo0J
VQIQILPIETITDRVEARAIHRHGVAALAHKMKLLGFLPQFPVLVSLMPEGKYRLLDGAHRLEAAMQTGLTEIYALVREPCANLLEEVAIARASNEASGTNVQTTMVDDAELIWRLSAVYKQEEIGHALGWSRQQVSQYALLQNVSQEAWDIIATTFDSEVHKNTNGRVAEIATAVASPFTENLLRNIVTLSAAQQLELCTDLATAKIKKAKFTDLALAYKARNDAMAWLIAQLGDMDEEFLDEGCAAIAAGHYDKEWQEQKGPGPKLMKLLESLRERWEKKYSIRLLQGNFYELIKGIGDSSIDAIIVDPPYNISTDRVYTLASQPDWSKEFGDWDKKTDMAFFQDIATWAKEYYRVMKPGTTGFMFVGEPYLNCAQGLFAQAGFEIKGTFVWCRTNPGPSVTKADFMPAIDLALQFVKPGAPRTFHYPGDEDGAGFNWQQFPICGGRERLVNSKKETLHPTQKPEAVIWYLMELITVPGDVVLDGFMGTGTTAMVAKTHNRKFVGFEDDDTYFVAARQRVEG